MKTDDMIWSIWSGTRHCFYQKEGLGLIFSYQEYLTLEHPLCSRHCVGCKMERKRGKNIIVAIKGPITTLKRFVT